MREVPRFIFLDDGGLINLSKINTIEMMPENENAEYTYLTEDESIPKFVLAIGCGAEDYYYLANKDAAKFLLKNKSILGCEYPSKLMNLINAYYGDV